MRDKIITGAAAGVTGGILQEALHLTVNVWLLKTTDMLLASVAGAMILGHKAQNWGEFAVGFTGHLILATFFGMLFAYVLELTEYRYYLLKGWLYGISLWFMNFTVGTQWRIDGVHHMNWAEKLSFLVPHMLYGFITAYVIYYLDERLDKKVR